VTNSNNALTFGERVRLLKFIEETATEAVDENSRALLSGWDVERIAREFSRIGALRPGLICTVSVVKTVIKQADWRLVNRRTRTERSGGGIGPMWNSVKEQTEAIRELSAKQSETHALVEQLLREWRGTRGL